MKPEKIRAALEWMKSQAVANPELHPMADAALAELASLEPSAASGGSCTCAGEGTCAWCCGRSSDSVRAHIAALEAERDEARNDAYAAVGALLEVVKTLTDDRKEPGIEAARRVVSERDALRERVKALEQERAALIERDKAAHDETRNATEERNGALSRALSAESTLAAIRQRAGKDGAMWEVFNAEPSITKGLRAVARHILGEDGARASAMCDGDGRKRDDGDGLKGWMKCGGCASCAEPDPTTAEAFATVRMTDERLRNLCEQDPGLDHDDAEEVLTELKRARTAETMLERRMGAMAGAMLRALADCACAPEECSTCVYLKDALADAAPGFTLEEVERLAAEHCSAGDASRLVRALAASRTVACTCTVPAGQPHQPGCPSYRYTLNARAERAGFTLDEVETVVRGALTDSGEWAPVVGIVMGSIRERLHALRR